MTQDISKVSLRTIRDIIQDHFEVVAKRLGPRSHRLMFVTDLPQLDRDLYLVHDVVAITCNSGMIAWIQYHHDEPGWIECAQDSFKRIGHPQVSDGLRACVKVYLAKRTSLSFEDGWEESRYVFKQEDEIVRSLYRHLCSHHFTFARKIS